MVNLNYFVNDCWIIRCGKLHHTCQIALEHYICVLKYVNKITMECTQHFLNKFKPVSS